LQKFVVISGCSGGGKSTLLGALRRRGFAVVPEPGRRIVSEELASDGRALPWVDGPAFARRAIEMSLADWSAAEALPGAIFFDRGLVDAAAALEHMTGEPAIDAWCRTYRYDGRVFLTPPWPELYVEDRERRHTLADAIAEYDRLLSVYRVLGYDVRILPKIGVEDRADVILSALGEANPDLA